MNQAKYEYQIVMAARHALDTLTKRELDEADEQHERMLQDTWQQQNDDDQFENQSGVNQWT